ncbi:MAG: Glu/Leu/Phe/Val dehydrogenase dimerization domain-containing protein [Anaeromyxobacter sp.]
MTELLDFSPEAVAAKLRDLGVSRFALTWDDAAGRLAASHPALEPLARAIEADARDFDRHEGLFVSVAPGTGVLQSAVVHRTCRGQAAGGVRYWRYDTFRDFLRDGLRLARGMTHKNALAGIWWGGGKGVMARGTGRDDGTPGFRRRVYEEFGALVSSLGGCYVTAEDVGTSVEDMAAVFSRTRFTTCIPPELGGSGNPSVPTALGVVRGMEAALRHRGMGTLAGKTVAIQGLGHVGTPLVGYLAERGVAAVVGADVDPGREADLRARFPGLKLTVRTVPRGDASILSEPADVVSPCATGAILGPATIPAIRAPIVCGAANNQLEDPARDDAALAARGITYLPDFLVNRMGIVTCADEQYGYVDRDPSIARHLGDDWENGVYRLSLSVLEEAKRTGRTPHRIALELAEARSREPHPVWGHRGRLIIRSLVERGWGEGR